MKIALFLVAACACITSVTAQTHVNPYTRKDGTFVPGHIRSAPDNTVDNNYSTRGNYNPQSGQQGTQRPSYERPAFEMPSYEQPRQQVCGVNSQGMYVCR